MRREIRKGRGPVIIRKLLKFNKIPLVTVRELLSDYDQHQQIRSLLSSRLRETPPRKACLKLIRRGFEAEAVREVLTEIEQKV